MLENVALIIIQRILREVQRAMGFPCGSAGKESTCSGRPGFNPWVGKIPWRRERLPIPVLWFGTGEGPKPHPHDCTLGESSREAQSGRRLLGTNGDKRRQVGPGWGACRQSRSGVGRVQGPSPETGGHRCRGLVFNWVQ